MELENEKLIVSSSPHIFTHEDTSYAMKQVIFALLPATLGGIYFFGIYSLIVIIVSVISSVLWEALALYIRRKPLTILKDYSAVVTGLLLALILPPNVPLWIPIIGTGVAILLAKQVFGGIGENFLKSCSCRESISLIFLSSNHDFLGKAHKWFRFYV